MIGPLDASIGKQVRQISAAQIDRLQAPSKAKGRGRGRSGTKPGSLLKMQIPIRTDNWGIDRPGYLEADTVAHGIVTATQDVEGRLPFAILGFDCDNGSEFLNHHLVNYYTDRKRKVGFTSSRPYQKNDNGHVEQKNWTHVRQLLGYRRLEDAEQLAAINELYREYWAPLHNYFLPSAKLANKHR
ncbi:MAG: integrase, partial [Verrucomicrobiales bacterium]|nr:integrase [Verrucomicrobiales bacterium]